MVKFFSYCEPLEKRCMLAATAFRAPAVPLITSDPYLSVWSEASKLTDANTVHWTGAENSLISLIRIDGTSYRLMGNDPSSLPAFPQTSVQVLPTRSIYDFDNGHVHVTMTFMQPALTSDLTAFSLPLSYITWDVNSVDGQNHSIQIYDSASSELSVNTTDQQVTWQRGSTSGGLTTLRVGTTAQTIFSPAGDQVRIDWGYAYLVAQANQITSSIGGDSFELTTFINTGALTNTDDTNAPRAVNNNQPVMAMAFNFGNVGSTHVQRYVMVAYDEIKSINYFGESLSPYWARNGTTVDQMLTTAQKNYPIYVAKTASFDTSLMADMTSEGGSDYAQLGALAYRQTFGATGLAVDPNGRLLAFPKENSSNGDVSTVDVLYPMFPQLLLFSPTLAKASLQPVMDYSASSLWNFPNAPHDLGTYPLVLGRPDGGEAMPVEETANMLIMLDAIAKEENSAEFAAQFWPLVSSWANYLKPFANTPGQQLTTDDFLGVITNSTNLAVKAIIGLGAYADLANRMGDPTTAASYTSLAQGDVTHWMSQSLSSDGTHWVLSYGDASSAAQQYNLVYDKILGTNLFPASVAAKDIAHDKTVLKTYGVPIRSTTNIVGVDWSVWDASNATNLTDFQTLINPIFNFMNVTSNRNPFTDKYDLTNLGSGLFKARTTVGGVFAKMLTDPAMWSKWSSQGQGTQGVYAGFPVKTVVVPDAQQSPQTWKYTTAPPAAGWQNAGFSDSSWATGSSGFGTAGTPGLVRSTDWSSADIYLRRTFTMPSGTFSNIQLDTYHDEDVEIYINGILAASASGYVTSYVALPISAAAKAQLVAGNTITLAVHCHQTVGGQGVDVGLATIQPGARPGRVSGTINGGKPGQTVFLDKNSNGALDPGELNTTTTASNVFNFSYVPIGSYTIRQILPPGLSQVSPGSNAGIAINVTNGAALTNQNFSDQPVGSTTVQLFGATIGTPGSFNNSGNTIAKATDGSLTTYFDGTTANGNWLGFDLGTSKTITQIAYAPRSNFANRLIGGKIQISTSANFSSSVTTIYTITTAPAVGTLTKITLTSAVSARYVRYLSPNGSYGNISEFQVFGPPANLTGTAIGTPGSYNNSGNTIAKAIDGILTTYFDGPTTNGNWVGLDLGSVKSISQIQYAPRSGFANRMIGGQFQISTTANFSSGVTTIYTINTAPASGVLTSLTLGSPLTARYVRYLSPNGSYGNISEFQVFA